MSSERADDFRPLRILAVAETWHGSFSLAFVDAFRRAGHSVSVIQEGSFSAAGWRGVPLRVLKRGIMPLIVREMTSAIMAEAECLAPELLFTMKGTMITPLALAAAQTTGVAINFWPDTSVTDHGYWPTVTLPRFDWIFTAKSFGVTDIQRLLSVQNVSFLSHGFDGQLHTPVGSLSEWDRQHYGSDVTFVGSWSAKKQKFLEKLKRGLPDIRMRIFGNGWSALGDSPLRESCAYRGVLSQEYTKAIAAAKVGLGLLFEGNPNAPQGDLTTTRTFEIPAIGTFMLHERTEEAKQYFEEDTECAMFGDADEMIEKARYYLAHDEERQRIAHAGHRRAVTSGYSVDDRAAVVIAKARELLATKAG